VDDPAASPDDQAPPADWPHPVPPLRLGPVPRDQRSEAVEDVLRPMRAMFAGDDQDPDQVPDANIFATLAWHPRLLARWSAFGGTLLFRGELPDRHRELLILRTAWNCRAHYEWGHHVPWARRVGVSAEEVEAVTAGPGAEVWSAEDAELLRAADELHAESRITDATWAGLAARYSPAQLIEVCMVVGQYHLVAFALNSLGVQLEPGP
jgi:alkylhydroperoxidase family enzyme